MRTSSEPGAPQLEYLLRSRLRVRGVGIRHRLHDDRRAASDRNAADAYLRGDSARESSHSSFSRATSIFM
jgi:hypothetical protein